MTSGLPVARGARATWVAAAVFGVAVGVAATLSLSFAAGLLVVGAAAWGLARSPSRAEIMVGLFWLAFTLYETLFASITISGFFYPFYLAFLATIVAALLRDGLRVHLPLLLSYAAFLLVVMPSFIGFDDAVDFEVVQRLVAYLMGGVLLLQFQSRRGLRPVVAAAVAASAIVSGWVIVNSIRGGFVYRGDIEADQNVVAFFVGFGVVIATALGLDAVARRAWGALLPLALVLGVTIYGSLLLASRGMVLALLLALAAVTVRAVARDRRAIVFVLVLAGLGGGAMLLPGGQGLLQRFEGERIETGGSRLPIWEATLEAYADGGVRELALGNGWASSRDLVQREIGTVSSTHNAWVQMLYEFGLLGLAAFAWLHAHLLIRSVSVPDPYGAIMAGITWFLIGANFSTNSPDGFMYWTALALALAIGSWAGRAGTAAPVEAEPRPAIRSGARA